MVVSAVATVVALALVSLAAYAPPSDRMLHSMPNHVPHRMPHRMPQRTSQLELNDTEAYIDYVGHSSSEHHKVAHHQKSTRHDASHHKRNLPHTMSAWKKITDKAWFMPFIYLYAAAEKKEEVLAQAFLGYAGAGGAGGADYDESISGGSGSDPEISSSKEAPQQNRKRSRFTAMASSALSAYLPKLWQKKRPRKKTRARKAAVKKDVPNAAVSSKVNGNSTTREQNVKQYEDEELAVEEGVPIVQQIFKTAGRPGVLSNPFISLKEIETKVDASGRKLTFIQYVAMLEIMILAVIAAGVFKSANLPVPIPLFAKA